MFNFLFNRHDTELHSINPVSPLNPLNLHTSSSTSSSISLLEKEEEKVKKSGTDSKIQKMDMTNDSSSLSMPDESSRSVSHPPILVNPTPPPPPLRAISTMIPIHSPIPMPIPIPIQTTAPQMPQTPTETTLVVSERKYQTFKRKTAASLPIPLEDLAIKQQIESWIQRIDDPTLLAPGDRPDVKGNKQQQQQKLQIYYDRDRFGKYETFAYYFSGIDFEKFENPPEEIEKYILRTQFHVFAGYPNKTPFMQVTWTSKVINDTRTNTNLPDQLLKERGENETITTQSLESRYKQANLLRRTSRLEKIKIPLLDSALEMDYSNSESLELIDRNGGQPLDKMSPADKIQIRHMTSILYKLQGTQTPKSLRCVLGCISTKPLRFRIRCWGFQTVLDEHMKFIVSLPIFRTSVERVWMDGIRKTLCIDIKSCEEPINEAWFPSGLYTTQLADFTPEFLMCPPDCTLGIITPLISSVASASSISSSSSVSVIPPTTSQLMHSSSEVRPQTLSQSPLPTFTPMIPSAPLYDDRKVSYDDGQNTNYNKKQRIEDHSFTSGFKTLGSVSINDYSEDYSTTSRGGRGNGNGYHDGNDFGSLRRKRKL